MSQSGAKASRDLKALAAEHTDRKFQLAMNDVQIKLECHQRAVAATTTFEKIGQVENTIPATTDVQLSYTKELYEWVTESLGGTE